MKSATILVGILLMVGVRCNYEHIPEEIIQGITPCMEELDISEDEYKQAMENHDFSNPKSHCIVECLMRVSGLMVDKEVNVEKLKKIVKHLYPEVSDEELEALNEKCLGEAQAKEDKCEFALAYEKCMKGSSGME